jgi:hypothetical protein
MQVAGDVQFDKPLDAKPQVLFHVNRLVDQDVVSDKYTDQMRVAIGATPWWERFGFSWVLLC